MADKICSICQQRFTEYGNNAAPINAGRCCDECDWRIVVPIRLRQVTRAYLDKMSREKGGDSQ